MNPNLEISPEVAAALAGGRAVLALESTIISHGMPYPGNLQTALAVEHCVREAGAIPATIAIMGGKLKVGLVESEIEQLAELGQKAVKCSRRDLPFLIENGHTGATTVAATMIIAEMAGIEVFATGGIGGVHRGAQVSMDISADLQELARTRVAVVCAGPKSILDIGLTLEYLETHGVPVIGYQTDELPAFYARSSGFKVDYRLDSPEQIAAVIKTNQTLGARGGLVVANPVPKHFALDRETVDGYIATAIQEAGQQGVSGKWLTPFLLERLDQLTRGQSLASNIELMKNNARLGSSIALAL